MDFIQTMIMIVSAFIVMIISMSFLSFKLFCNWFPSFSGILSNVESPSLPVWFPKSMGAILSRWCTSSCWPLMSNFLAITRDSSFVSSSNNDSQMRDKSIFAVILWHLTFLSILIGLLCHFDDHRLNRWSSLNKRKNNGFTYRYC